MGLLSRAGALSDVQGQNGAERAHSSGSVVGRRQPAEEDWRVFGAALGSLEADEGLSQRVQTGSVRVGPGPAESGHVGLDHRGVQHAQCLRADAHPVRRPRTHVRYQDIRLGGNSLRDLSP